MLVAFSGLKNSGKDTVASVLVEEYGFTKIAFADALREALLVLDPLIEVEKRQSWAITHGGNQIISFVATPLSEVIADIGWDKAKNSIPEVRRLMQVFGTEVGRMLFGTDVWIDALAKRFPDLGELESRYVITDCRFMNEANFVYQNKGIICWISRPGLVSNGHDSEKGEVEDLAGYFFKNDSTIDELKEDVRFLMHLKGIDPIG